MSIEAFISFNGNCREAVDFYAKVFGQDKPQIMSYGDGPSDPEFPLTEESKDLVMFTFLSISGSRVLFSDNPPGMPYVSGNNIGLTIVSKELDEIKSWFASLKVGGKVIMDLQETFWSKCYGFLTDKFGIQWQFNYDSGQMK